MRTGGYGNVDEIRRADDGIDDLRRTAQWNLDFAALSVSLAACANSAGLAFEHDADG
jgi:hypothetical protein